ncbi:MAG: hypothetical protein AAFV07_11020 [Bacteroidota bacterium]
MQFSQFLKYVLPVMVILLVAGCKPDVKSRTELLTEVQWGFQGILSSTLEPDEFNGYKEFFEKVLIKYNTDGTYDVNFIDNIADPYSGTWVFNSDETNITQDEGTDDEGRLVIISLAEGAFSYAFTDSLGTYELSWVHAQ